MYSSQRCDCVDVEYCSGITNNHCELMMRNLRNQNKMLSYHSRKKNHSIVLKKRCWTWIFHYFWRQLYRFLADELYCDNFTVFQIHEGIKMLIYIMGEWRSYMNSWILNIQDNLKCSTKSICGVINLRWNI